MAQHDPHSANYSAVPTNPSSSSQRELERSPAEDAVNYRIVRTDPSSSSQRELEHNPAEDASLLGPGSFVRRQRRPLILHPLVGWGLVALCVSLSVILAVLYWYSQTRNGLFTIYPVQGFRDEVLQSLWSSGPTFLMAVITGGILGPMAFELYVVASYVELEGGNATAEASILASYVVRSPYKRFRHALDNNKPGLVTLSMACFLAALLGTAASGLIESRNVATKMNWTVQVGITQSDDGTVGADGSRILITSAECLAAVLYAGGQQLYQPSPVPYSYYGLEGNWSINPLVLPAYKLPAFGRGFNSSIVSNLTVETFGINSNANCRPASITFRENATITATVDQCSADFPVSTNDTFTRWHNATSITCSNASKTNAGFKTFVYSVYGPSGYAARDPSQFLFMFYQPSIFIAKISATLSVTHDGQIGALVAPPVVLMTCPIGSNTSDPYVNRLLGPPLYGNALNGYDIPEPVGSQNLSRYDRVMVVQSILYEGIYGAQLDHMGNDTLGTDTDWFTPSNRIQLGNIISDFYQAYVSTLSRSIYYDSNSTEEIMIDGMMSTLRRELWYHG